MKYEPRISTGNLITIGFGFLAMLAAYWVFVTSTNTSLAQQSQRLDQHDLQILELKDALDDLPTRLQVQNLKESFKKVEDDLDWLVKREIEKADRE